MKNFKLFFMLISIFIITSCSHKNDDFSKSEVEKMTITDQKKYLNEHYGLDYKTLINMSDAQFSELLKLHLDGLFEKTSLNQAWKEWANLSDKKSIEYIKQNFHDYENMSIILSIYGPMFYDK